MIWSSVICPRMLHKLHLFVAFVCNIFTHFHRAEGYFIPPLQLVYDIIPSTGDRWRGKTSWCWFITFDKFTTSLFSQLDRLILCSGGNNVVGGDRVGGTDLSLHITLTLISTYALRFHFFHSKSLYFLQNISTPLKSFLHLLSVIITLFIFQL